MHRKCDFTFDFDLALTTFTFSIVTATSTPVTIIHTLPLMIFPLLLWMEEILHHLHTKHFQ